MPAPSPCSQALPGVTLSWSNVTYEVPVHSQKEGRTSRVLLDDVSGMVKPGQVMAIMGPSGSGKSTLLSTLAGRLPRSGRLTGEILVNKKPREEESFRALSAYSLQDDNLFSFFTVRETLQMAAELRMPACSTRSERDEAVESIISVMGLRKSADTRIGDHETRGISGGERKRVSIAVEIINRPSLIFLDEPTSGLDSFQAESVMQAMLDLAKRGFSVISVIHQPRSSIFSMFDQLQLISEGRVMFSGPAAAAEDYFAAQGFPCPAGYNVADHFLDTVSLDYRSPEAQEASAARVKELAALSASVSGGKAPQIEEKEHPADHCTTVPSAGDRGRRPGLTRQFGVLGKRAFRQTIRNFLPIAIQAAQTVVIVSLLGLLWGVSQQVSSMSMISLRGLLFFVVSDTALGSMFHIATGFPSERSIVNRERDAGAYGAFPYFVTKALCEIPFKLLPKTIGFSALYWWVGMNASVTHFFTFVLVIAVLYITCAGAGYMIGAWSKNFQVANALCPIFLLLWILFSGFLIPLVELPHGSLWVAYANPLQWALVAININEKEGGMSQAPPIDSVLFRRSLPPAISDVSKWQAIACCALIALAFYSIGLLGLVVNRNRYQSLSSMTNSVIHAKLKSVTVVGSKD